VLQVEAPLAMHQQSSSNVLQHTMLPNGCSCLHWGSAGVWCLGLKGLWVWGCVPGVLCNGWSGCPC
jgi:hypothetical protein